MELCVVVNFSKPRAQTVLSPIVERHLCHHITVHFGTDFGCDFRFIELVSENPRILYSITFRTEIWPSSSIWTSFPKCSSRFPHWYASCSPRKDVYGIGLTLSELH